MIDALYCRSTAVLLAMHVWLYVVAVLEVLYMVSDAGWPRGVELSLFYTRRRAGLRTRRRRRQQGAVGKSRHAPGAEAGLGGDLCDRTDHI